MCIIGHISRGVETGVETGVEMGVEMEVWPAHADPVGLSGNSPDACARPQSDPNRL